MIALLFALVAGMANGWMDLITFHFYLAPKFMTRNNNFWNPKESWKNKYKYRDSKNEKTFIGKYFTGLTDGWHFLKLIMKWSFIFMAISYGVIGIYFDTTIIRLTIDPVLLYLAFQSGFKITYK